MKSITNSAKDLFTKMSRGVGKANNTTETSPILKKMTNTYTKKISGRLTIPKINTTQFTGPLKKGLSTINQQRRRMINKGKQYKQKAYGTLQNKKRSLKQTLSNRARNAKNKFNKTRNTIQTRIKTLKTKMTYKKKNNQQNRNNPGK